MKYLSRFCFFCFIMVNLSACHTTGHVKKTTRQINKAIAAKDSSAFVITKQSNADSVIMVNKSLDNLHQHFIDFKTFYARIKVQYEDNSKGKQPDIIAIVRIVKDSAIWISLSASILNFEVYRMLITKDSVILMNIHDKEVQYRSLDYLQDITEIPFDYSTLQNLLIGNPIFFENKIVSYKKTEAHILILTVGGYFKHLLTLSADNNLLLHSKLDDVDIARNRTADITYDDYENRDGFYFSTYREITVSEKNRLDIRFNFKQYEFNKDLSVSFKVPKNYTRK